MKTGACSRGYTRVVISAEPRRSYLVRRPRGSTILGTEVSLVVADYEQKDQGDTAKGQQPGRHI